MAYKKNIIPAFNFCKWKASAEIKSYLEGIESYALLAWF